jgi:hypothetical protein
MADRNEARTFQFGLYVKGRTSRAAPRRQSLDDEIARLISELVQHPNHVHIRPSFPGNIVRKKTRGQFPSSSTASVMVFLMFSLD